MARAETRVIFPSSTRACNISSPSNLRGVSSCQKQPKSAARDEPFARIPRATAPLRSRAIDRASMSAAVSADAAKRVIVAGDARATFDDLVARVHTVHANPKAGPFDAVLVAGRIYDGDAAEETMRGYQDGTKSCEVPVYFVDPDGEKGLEFARSAAAKRASETKDGSKEKGLLEIAPNVYFMSESRVYELCGGLKVASVPGRFDVLSYEDASAIGKSTAKRNGETTEDDVTSMKASFDELPKNDVVDVLLTRDWPAGTLDVHGREVGSEAKSASSTGSPVSRALALTLAPRYHFAGSHPFFFEREPYINVKTGSSDPASAQSWVTRFINIAYCSNADGEKWMHALKIEPGSAMDRALLCKIPPDTGPNPYLGAPGQKRRAADLQPDWRDGAKKPKTDARGGNRDARDIKGDLDKTIYVRNLSWDAEEGAIAEYFGECGELVDLRLARNRDNNRSRGYGWISFTTVEGAQAALERNQASFFGRDITVEMANAPSERQPRRPTPGVAPGGCWFCLSNEKDLHLVASIGSECFVSMDKGGLTHEHCQIVPVEHLPCFANVPESTATEMWNYIGALRRYAESKSHKLVIFERYLELLSKGGNHCHMNCVPVEADRAVLSEKIFKQAAKRLDFSWTKLEPPANAADAQAAIKSVAGDGEYYAVHLPDGCILIRSIERGEKHWMQLGREVISHLIKAPERANWQSCMEDEAKETERTTAFVEAFDSFDPMKQG